MCIVSWQQCINYTVIYQRLQHEMNGPQRSAMIFVHQRCRQEHKRLHMYMCASINSQTIHIYIIHTRLRIYAECICIHQHQFHRRKNINRYCTTATIDNFIFISIQESQLPMGEIQRPSRIARATVKKFPQFDRVDVCMCVRICICGLDLLTHVRIL